MRRHIISIGLIAAGAVLALTAACGSDGDGACSSGTFCDPGNPNQDGGSSGFASSGFGTSSGDNGTSGTSGTDPGDGGNFVDAPVAVCGNGIQDGNDTCDDGNTKSGDGCSDTCKLEDGFVCNVPNTPCAPIGGCGDGVLQKGEDCDDKNTVDGDGCTKCKVDKGWICAIPATACVAAECGDGIVAGKEECDDKNPNNGDGCTKCVVDDGYKCDKPGEKCTKTTCGDGHKEGTEQCDDGNKIPFDHCSPDCTAEPICPPTGGECAGACGDGIVFPGEQCDDGNTRDGDGCSHDCKNEAGFKCSLSADAFPDVINSPIIYRDFSRGDGQGYCATDGNCPSAHPDMDTYSGDPKGIAGYALGHPSQNASNLGVLDAQGKPQGKCLGTGFGKNCTVTSADSFAQWYRSIDKDPVTQKRVNYTILATLPLSAIKVGGKNSGAYQFDSGGDSFFPIDGKGFGNEYLASTDDGNGGNHNFHFTSELRFWFQYDDAAVANAPEFDFTGDDDVYVFINGKLAVDIGGVHNPLSDKVILDADKAQALGLTKGKVYEFALFQAERNRKLSNYHATFKGFARAKSVCASTCGQDPPVKTPDEVCDDGSKNATTNTPGYGQCAKDCKSRGGYCGDGTTDTPDETCDDGPFNGGYGKCNTTCKGPGPRCGDGHIDTAFGEICDDAGANAPADAGAVPYNTCASDCRSKPRCGDGIINGNEQCDGAQVNGVPCSATCTLLTSGPH